MKLKSINHRILAELATVALLTISSFYAANAGVQLGAMQWKQLPFRYAEYGMSNASASAWNNMIAVSLAVMVLLAYIGDWVYRASVLTEYQTQPAPTRFKQPWFRALHAVVGTAFFLIAGFLLQGDVPDPQPLNSISVFCDGVLIRTLGLEAMYIGIRFLPYLAVREYLRLTGRLGNS